jgi:hypothetical protein
MEDSTILGSVILILIVIGGGYWAWEKFRPIETTEVSVD